MLSGANATSGHIISYGCASQRVDGEGEEGEE